MNPTTSFIYKSMKQELSGKGYSEFRYLGQGAQGYVLLAKEQKTNRRYAIKGVHVRDDEGNIDSKIFQQAQQEINMLNTCKGSPYVVNLIDQIEGKEFIYLVLTECQGIKFTKIRQYNIFFKGTLNEIIEKNQDKIINQLSAIKYSKDIAEGLYFIHSKNCVVNDLKMDNILIDYNGNAVLTILINDQIADFGFADNLTKMSGYGKNEYVILFCQINQIYLTNFTVKMGNWYFMAPECYEKFYDEEYKNRGITTQKKPSQRVIIQQIYQHSNYNYINNVKIQSEACSLGYLIYTMISGEKQGLVLQKHLPLEYNNDFQQFIYKKQLKYIIDGLTQFNPRDRISVKEVLILLKGMISYEFKLDEKFIELMDGKTQEIVNQSTKQIEFVENFSNKYYPIMQFEEIQNKNENSFVQEILQNIDDELNKNYKNLEIQYKQLLETLLISKKKIKDLEGIINDLQNKLEQNQNIQLVEGSYLPINQSTQQQKKKLENQNVLKTNQKQCVIYLNYFFLKMFNQLKIQKKTGNAEQTLIFKIGSNIFV